MPTANVIVLHHDRNASIHKHDSRKKHDGVQIEWPTKSTKCDNERNVRQLTTVTIDTILQPLSRFAFGGRY